MTRKATAKKPKAGKSKKGKPKAAKKPAKPRAVIAYVAVRTIPSESPSFSEPDRVFATRDAALKFAEQRNRELRQLVNPFSDRSADYLLTGGEEALTALVKQLGLPVPAKTKSYGYSIIEWTQWWDGHYFDVTDAQRDAIWDALDKYNWYTVRETKVE